jgi:predicted CXXCH cytochrome family protein
MKKYLLPFLCFAFGIGLLSLLVTQMPTSLEAGSYNYTGGTGIYNTPHDLRPGTEAGGLYGADDYLNRLCVWCHAPHHTLRPDDAPIANAYTPLWNRGISEETFTPYDNGNDPSTGPHKLQADVSGGPGAVSRLCLSCHDGSIAVNTYGYEPQDSRSRKTGNTTISAQYLIGGLGDLSNHHPIGFVYNDVVANDPEIQEASAYMLNAAAGGTGRGGSVTLKIEDLLYDGKMECVTCHDVHNSQNPGAEKFLWKSDNNSAFCVTCHLKGTP